MINVISKIINDYNFSDQMSKTGNLHIICHDFSANSKIQQKRSDSICRQLKSGIITQAKNDKVNLIYSSVDKTDNYLEESTIFSNIVAGAVWEPFSVKKIQTFLSELRQLSPCFKVANFEGIFQIITDLIVNAQIKANNRSITIYSDKWESLKITQNIERALEVLDQTQCDVNLVYRMLEKPNKINIICVNFCFPVFKISKIDSIRKVS